MNDGPLIVQSDRTLLLEIAHPTADRCRLDIATFAELEKSPEHVHTYRITPLGLWNARAAGIDAETVVDVLVRHSRYPVPHAILVDVVDQMDRYGRVVIEAHPTHGLILRGADAATLDEVLAGVRVAELVGDRIEPEIVALDRRRRGQLKQELVRVGWPAEDLAGFVDGAAHPMALRRDSFDLRPYQRKAVDSFAASGNGVVVLPCGAGKTIVGAASMAEAAVRTLILVTNTVSARQWRAELLARTTLTDEEIGEYSGQVKILRPVTIATYQILVSKRDGYHPHLDILDAEDWGLVIYDEVHLLPAPVFRVTADIQSRRRLGLTATLVREDGLEADVFSLIGPKRYDAPWKEIEAQGWIAPALCTEVRVNLSEAERTMVATARRRDRYRLAAIVRTKLDVVDTLVARHSEEPVLIIGQYLEQLEEIADRVGAPVLTGRTPLAEREDYFAAFRRGDLAILVVSKIANFSIDLPEASVAIQVSGSFGSRQEEAQRLGRLLRPKEDGRAAQFYTVVSRDTVDQDFAANRQRFLAEQGYRYEIIDADTL